MKSTSTDGDFRDSGAFDENYRVRNVIFIREFGEYCWRLEINRSETASYGGTGKFRNRLRGMAGTDGRCRGTLLARGEARFEDRLEVGSSPPSEPVVDRGSAPFHQKHQKYLQFMLFMYWRRSCVLF